MSRVGGDGVVASRSREPASPVDLGEVPVAILQEIARRHGTPTYAYDLRRIRAQDTRFWHAILAEESSYGAPDDYFRRRLNHGLDASMMRPAEPPKRV